MTEKARRNLEEILQVAMDAALDVNDNELAEHLRDLAQYARYSASNTLLAKLDEQAAQRKRKEYFDSVRSIAEELAAEVVDENPADLDAAREQLYDRTHERVDDSEWVIYTRRNYDVLLASDNADAAVDEGMMILPANYLAVLAFWAMRTDVMEHAAPELERLLEERGERDEDEG